MKDLVWRTKVGGSWETALETDCWPLHAPVLTHTYVPSQQTLEQGWGVAHWLEFMPNLHEPLGFKPWVSCLLPDSQINPETSCLS